MPRKTPKQYRAELVFNILYLLFFFVSFIRFFFVFVFTEMIVTTAMPHKWRWWQWRWWRRWQWRCHRRRSRWRQRGVTGWRMCRVTAPWDFRWRGRETSFSKPFQFSFWFDFDFLSFSFFSFFFSVMQKVLIRWKTGKLESLKADSRTQYLVSGVRGLESRREKYGKKSNEKEKRKW